MKETEVEKTYNLKCHVNCPFFPINIANGEINWEYKEQLKKRSKPINYICGYDGHIIKKWTDECPYIKEHKES